MWKEVFSQETVFLAHSIVMGMLLTWIYDWFLILRKLWKHSTFQISIEDFFYWLFTASLVFVALYGENNGTLRWFAVLGAFLGMVFYKKTISKLFCRCSLFALRTIIKVVKWIFKPVYHIAVNAYLLGRKKLTSRIKMLKIMVKQQRSDKEFLNGKKRIQREDTFKKNCISKKSPK